MGQPISFQSLYALSPSPNEKSLFLTLNANSTFWHIFHSIPPPLPLFYLPFGREPFSILETSHIAGLHLSPSPAFSL